MARTHVWLFFFPADRGGEGGNQGGASFLFLALWSWCCSFLWLVRSYCNPLLLPPLVRGRMRSVDGGRFIEVWWRRIFVALVPFVVVSLFILLAAMVVEGRWHAAAGGGSRRLQSVEVFDSSSSSSTVRCDLMELLVSSNTCSTSDARPLLRSGVAVVLVGMEASGYVPAKVLGNDKHDSLLSVLDGGEKEGFAILHLLARSFLFSLGTYVLFFFLMWSSVISLYTHFMV